MMPRHSRWGLLALALGFSFAAQAHAWDPSCPPVKVNCKLIFEFDVKCKYQQEPTAPWYTYFPYDPQLMGPRGSMYPGWPQPFPPKDARGQTTPQRMATAPIPSWPGAAPQPAPYQQAPPQPRPNLMQTSYYPSYWQGR